MNRKVIIINVLIIILAAEIICRIFLVNTYDAQFFRIDRIIYDAMYSNLRDMEQTKENTLDILLLGASVIHSDFASIDSIIELELGNALDRAVNVHNLSYPAHNMRDSYEKMIRLGNYNYDYLIIGINDVRMNNCPLDIYRQDYSHSKWFVMLDIFKSHPERIITAIPLTIHLITENILQQTGRHQYLPVHIPPEHWVREGRIIKNKKTYRYYLKAIIDTALNHGIRVILPGFAFYLPDNYNKYSFENKLLDYNEHLCPVSIWGTPENVVNGIMSNNSITMSLAMEYNIPFISMNLCIPHNKEYYNDICHLTPKGISIMSQKLAEHIVSMEQTKNNLTPE